MVQTLKLIFYSLGRRFHCPINYSQTANLMIFIALRTLLQIRNPLSLTRKVKIIMLNRVRIRIKCSFLIIMYQDNWMDLHLRTLVWKLYNLPRALICWRKIWNSLTMLATLKNNSWTEKISICSSILMYFQADTRGPNTSLIT